MSDHNNPYQARNLKSKECQTLAAAAWDDDFSGSSLIVCENGKLKRTVSDESEEDGWVSFLRARRPKVDPKDPFTAIREAETDGANYDLDTEDIIARLKQWQSLCSFRVTGAAYDTVIIEFETLSKDLDAFVRDLYDFCPDLVDQGTGCVQEMLQVMEAAGKKPTKEMQKLIEGVDFEDEDYGLEILKRELQQKKAVRLWWD